MTVSPPEGVALLPFVDERRLRAALADVYPDLTAEEGEQLDWEWPSIPTLLPVSVLSSSNVLPVSVQSSQCPHCSLLHLVFQ